jgi:hypothetical protein
MHSFGKKCTVLENALHSQISKHHQIINPCPIAVNHSSLAQLSLPNSYSAASVH